MVAAGDVEGLAAVVGDDRAPDATRQGAIEALARIATEAAEAPILAVARAESEDEDLRRAAWRALRRARRVRAARAQSEVRP